MEQKLKVKIIGELSLKDLPQAEADIFYLTLLNRVIESYQKKCERESSPLKTRREG